MSKTFEQRIAYLEKVITNFFTGSERKAKKAVRTVKRKTKSARKSISQKPTRRKISKRSRSA
ncbi:MAG TPA: hypothetical protein VNX61_05125 [Rhizomicrobium sp.]|jgi:hypothetical protein|nr:hypothetical protein [Rhizomicrobium sp.]